MHTKEISELIRTHLGPGGDLYLSRNKAQGLIRWLEANEKWIRDQDALIRELQDLLKAYPLPGVI